MSLNYRIMHKPEDSITFKEFISYNTKEECINYLEMVNPTLRPVYIVTGQQVVRAYDYGIIDYELIDEIEKENQELRDGLWGVHRKTTGGKSNSI